MDQTIKVEYTQDTGPEFPTNGSIATAASSTAVVASVATAYPLNPQKGQMVYRTDLNHLYVWTGTTWGQA